MTATGTTEPGELGVGLEVPGEAVEATPLAPPELGFVRRRVDKVFWICVGWIGLMAFCAVFANFLPLTNPNNPTAQPVLGPSLAHPFGTDTVGYDLFSLCIHGARMSMLIGISSAVVGVLIGGSIGVIAGYAKGLVDQSLSWVVDVMLAFPALVFALAIVSFVGASTTSVIAVIAVLSIPGYARVARAVTLTYSEADFVLASRSLGAKAGRVVVREIVPNVAVSLLSFAALGAAIAIITEGALAFLGLGAPSVVSWGNMILQGQQQLTAAPQAALAPMGMMFFTIVALNFIGERLGAVIDPREGQL